MKVILLTDIQNLGKKNDIVDVSDGYAKNFLIKNNLANGIDNKTIKQRQQNIDLEKYNENLSILNAKALKQKLEKMVLNFELKANNGNAFGVISNKMIVDAINNDEKIIDKHMLNESYKLSIGKFDIKINLYKDIYAIVKVIVKGI